MAEIVGAKLADEVKKQVEGRSLAPLLKNPKAEWADRTLITHVGRWPRGKAAESKYVNCSIRNTRFTLVKNEELYDLKSDPGQNKNVTADYPDVVASLRKAYDQWWNAVQPLLVNEDSIGPRLNPFKELYWKQFGGGPDAGMPK